MERENAMLKRKLARFEGEADRDEDQQEDNRKIERFMNQVDCELEVESLGQARRYFKKMK